MLDVIEEEGEGEHEMEAPEAPEAAGDARGASSGRKALRHVSSARSRSRSIGLCGLGAVGAVFGEGALTCLAASFCSQFFACEL